MSSPQFIDTHAHLYLLEHASRDEIISRSDEAGIQKMVTVSVDEKSWGTNREDSQKHEHVFYSIGLHPHEAKDWQTLKPKMKSLFDQGVPPKCVAIGEMGMDFYYDNSPKEMQIEAFEEQLQFANQWNLPIIIHCRDAFDLVYDSIRSIGLNPKGGVMHCFTGGPDEAKAAVDIGLKISFSGILTFKNAQKIRDAAKSLSLNDVVLETDCPFLAPVPVRGKPNEPSYLPHTAACLAQTMGYRIEVIAQHTTENAKRLFGLP